MRLSVVMPARDEEGSIAETVQAVCERLRAEGIEHEVLCVDDGSTDATAAVIERLAEEDPAVRLVTVQGSHGFGFAVRAGLEAYTGDAVAIMMADLSDAPEDLVAYHRVLEAGYDCAFGSRFAPGGSTHGYPRHKLLVNRVVNQGLRVLFGHGYDDTTNAFKAYRREVIDTVAPLVSHHFNLTVELPLKAVVRGHSFAIVPITWRNRRTGVSKLRLQEMGSRYAYVSLMVLLEHHLARGDYRRTGYEPQVGRRGRAARRRPAAGGGYPTRRS